MIDVGGGVQLYHEDFGDGQPVVFVHGGAATHTLWDHQIHHLSSRFRTVVYDHRGVGGSDKPRDGYTVDQLADDLAALVRGLGLDGGEVTLVSHGLGGHVVLRCVHRHPDVAGRLALTAAAPWYVGDRAGAGGFSERFADDLGARLGRNHPQVNWDLIGNWLFHDDPGEAVRIAHLQMAMAWPLHVLRTLMEDLPNADHRPYLGDIVQPTLVLHGRHDRKNRFEGAEFLADHLPQGRLTVFERSAHCPFLEEVDAFNGAIATFAGGS
jgi:pimeloyl-ACP methyl ester carboxylesterase